MIKVELSRFRVKPGKSKTVDEWLDFLNRHMEDTLVTLKDEKMFIESIHREIVDGDEFLYWYSVQGEGGVDVRESKHDIDIKHLAYWDECIDETYQSGLIQTSVIMIFHSIRDAMQ